MYGQFILGNLSRLFCHRVWHMIKLTIDVKFRPKAKFKFRCDKHKQNSDENMCLSLLSAMSSAML
jgi:hypothetical protein